VRIANRSLLAAATVAQLSAASVLLCSVAAAFKCVLMVLLLHLPLRQLASRKA
jgi:hypothetical protein